jgi:predicted negative regulator of RcsB-dependent stress response
VDDLLSEKEQIDQMRAWWSEYGNYVIGGVVAGALILFGINYYQSSKLNAQLEASALFETLAEHVVDGKLDDAESVAAEIETAYANTIYASQSKLAMARLYMDKNRDQDAADELNELLALSGAEQVKDIARLRLARIYLYQDKAQEVIDLLQGQDNEAFAGRYAEVRGDAYAALGQVAEAETEYQAALTDPMSSQTIDRALLQWKILDLPEAEEPAVEEPAVEAEAVVEPEAATDDDTEAAE